MYAGREADARRLLGKTPRMIATFARVSGFPYPYPKYAQSTVYDFRRRDGEHQRHDAHGTPLQDRRIDRPEL